METGRLYPASDPQAGSTGKLSTRDKAPLFSESA
jgi:hypothetical protein